MEASRIADRVLALTPREAFAEPVYDTIEANLEHFSMAVFCDLQGWAQWSLDNVKEMTRPLF